MVNFPGRNGRRRRVLNEEVLSASSSHATLRAMPKIDDDRTVPRYSDAAGVENHAQITDFIPRRYRSIALLIAAGGISTAAIASLDYFATPIARTLGATQIVALKLMAPGSFGAWVAAVVLLLASAASILVYSLRRHRIDDFRGRYRIWLAVAVACLLVSANSVTGFHNLLAAAMSHLTGWTALRAGAIWWLVLAILPLVWIALRSLVEVRESRLAASLLVAAVGCYVGAATTALGAVSFADPRIEIALSGAVLLMGHWILLAAVVSYARYVVLDAQGLIAAQPRIVSKRKTQKPTRRAKEDSSEREAPAASPTLSAAEFIRRKQQQAQGPKAPAVSSAWVDGSQPQRDPYDDGDDDESSDGRKLSKAERKRLRKLKMQNRAA
jgi:hypothetical protein